MTIGSLSNITTDGSSLQDLSITSTTLVRSLSLTLDGATLELCVRQSSGKHITLFNAIEGHF